MDSSEGWAKENEWRDSEGNLDRSSPKLIVGEEGPEAVIVDADRDFESERVIELDRGPTEWVRDDDPEDPRAGGCWRIRRRPEAPSPCSCSAMWGVLKSL